MDRQRGPAACCGIQEAETLETDTRQLAAIMLTDIVGYTALMQTDEASTLALLAEHTALLRPLFAEHGGREVKGTGDGFLVEFPSALQAVRCAVGVQRALHERNLPLPLNRAIQVRIGVHLGDVVHRGADIFGDGVNITARIEPLAKPGGICLSRQVYDQVWNKIDLRVASLGKHALKNVSVPIEVYEIALPWAERDASPKQAGEPSRLVVLPLVSMSPNSEDEYFADGLTEELIFTLSKTTGLQVIALTSAMKYRGAKKAVAEIGSELRVGAVLEGSVRKAGSRLRITLQLIDVASEGHLWAEAYDRTLDDVFRVQTEVARSVAAALEGKLAPKPPPLGQGTPEHANPEAYGAYLKGRVLLTQRTAANIEAAVASLRRAIDEDPTCAEAHAALAMAYGLLPDYVPMAPTDSLDRAVASARWALALDSSLPEAHAALGLAMQNKWEWRSAEQEFLRAIELSPSYAVARHWLGLLLMGFGRFAEAVSMLKEAQGLDPLSAVLRTALGQIYLCAGEHDLALTEFAASLALGEDNRVLRGFRGETHLNAGEYVLARADFERGRELSESFDPFIELGLARTREALGEQGAIEASLAQAADHGVSPYWLAAYSFALGRNDEGFELLERAYGRRDFELITLAVDPRLLSCRSDPRYSDLVRRMALA
jgi:TolB-like protein/Tfp pilus assembly protein PilF